MTTLKTTLAAAVLLLGLGAIGAANYDHPAIQRHINQFCPSLCQ